MTRVFDPNEDVLVVVDAVLSQGYAAIEGTKSMAVPYCNRVIETLQPYDHVAPVQSFQNVQNHGYLYLVVDTKRYSLSAAELRQLVHHLDHRDPG